MTKFIHDQFAKDYLEQLLKPYREVTAPQRIASEVRQIDVFFSPFIANNPNLGILGLLGEFATIPAIFEPFRNAAPEKEICNCLGKAVRTAIVAIHQLPKITETLWIRMLGRGTVQKRAIDELMALPQDHPYRGITLELLYNLQQNLRTSTTIRVRGQGVNYEASTTLSRRKGKD